MKRFTLFWACLCACLCLVGLSTTVFAASAGSHQVFTDVLGLNTGMNVNSLMNTLTAPAGILAQAQKNQTVENQTMMTAPVNVTAAGSMNTNADEACATNSPPVEIAAMICMNANDLKNDEKIILMTVAVSTESSGGGLKTPVLCGVDTMGQDELTAMAASGMQDTHRCMIVGALNNGHCEGMITTDSISGRGIA